MANKENLSPYATTWRIPAHDGSRSTVTAISNTRYQKPTPLFGLSPSKNPLLSQQRDHSACRITDSPLKVRKTRENLKEHETYTSVPPPCVHEVHTSVEIANYDPSDRLNTSGSTLVGTCGDESPIMRPVELKPAPGKMQRHKSVSRRMLSKVKEGISHRSRSSQSTRAPAGSDTGLMRKLSGKAQQSSEEQPRMRSFEISRNSIDSLTDENDIDAEAPPDYRSFTDSSISTDGPMSSFPATTPPQHPGPLTPKATVHTRQYSGRLLSPSPKPDSPSRVSTPRAIMKSIEFGLARDSMNEDLTIPFVDLSIMVDRNSVDVSTTKDVWVAIEGTVRTRVVGASGTQFDRKRPLRKRSIDAVIILSQDVLECEQKATHKCIVELCSRLNIAGDRLVVLGARLQQTGTSAVHCECEQLHPLQGPRLTQLFERLGIAPSTINTIIEEDWQSLPDSLQYLTETGLRKDRAETFVISKTPDLLVQIVHHLVQWPVHSFKIGLSSDRATAATSQTRHNWAVQINGDADDSVDIYDNMLKDLRHGHPMGFIPSLRMCYKPRQGCQILEVLGQKALNDLRLGQRCFLFLKVQVPRVDTSRSDIQDQANDTDSLFAELESIVGTLETDLIHVEARYRHSLLPSESVVTVRHDCNVRRPKSESRWSTVGREGDAARPERVHVALAQFLAMHYPPARALRMIDRWVMQSHGSPSAALQQVRKHLDMQVIATGGLHSRSTSVSPAFEKPSVVVTDIDNEAHATVPSSSKVEGVSEQLPSKGSLADRQSQIEMSTLSPKSSIASVRTISAAKTTTAITIAGTSQIETSLNESEDSARQLWRHIRHHSLSAKQLAEMTPTKLQQIEDCDENIKALRHKALTNKRSVGAETLRAWKWEERENGGGGEAPWL